MTTLPCTAERKWLRLAVAATGMHNSERWMGADWCRHLCVCVVLWCQLWWAPAAAVQVSAAEWTTCRAQRVASERLSTEGRTATGQTWPRSVTSDLWPAQFSLRYDTIRDAVLTCHAKPDVSQLNLYCTGPKSEKTGKLKIKKWTCSEVSANSLGNPLIQSWRRKGGLWWEGFAEKEGFKPGMEEWGVMEY